VGAQSPPFPVPRVPAQRSARVQERRLPSSSQAPSPAVVGSVSLGQNACLPQQKPRKQRKFNSLGLKSFIPWIRFISGTSVASPTHDSCRVISKRPALLPPARGVRQGHPRRVMPPGWHTFALNSRPGSPVHGRTRFQNSLGVSGTTPDTSNGSTAFPATTRREAGPTAATRRAEGLSLSASSKVRHRLWIRSGRRQAHSPLPRGTPGASRGTVQPSPLSAWADFRRMFRRTGSWNGFRK